MELRRLTHFAVVMFAFFLSACHDTHFAPRVAEGEIGIHDDLYAVASPGNNRVIAVGYFGAIFLSEDGGNKWVRRSADTQASLYGIAMADEKRGWIVGQLGTILRTEDGGRTWAAQENPKKKEGSHLFSVYAIDANTALAIGEWGSILYTENAGKTWEDRSFLIHEKHPQFVWLAPVQQQRVREGDRVYEDVGLNNINCLPGSDLCWIVGEFGSIYRSTDRFKTWEQGKIVGRIGVDPIEFASFSSEVSAAGEARLRDFIAQIIDQPHLKVEIFPYVTKQERAKMSPESDPSEFFDLVESRAEHVRSIFEAEGILSDRIRMRGSPPWDYEDFLADDPQFLTRYLNGRESARPQVTISVMQNPYLFQSYFTDAKHGVIAGLGGVILFSEDGGLNWDYAPTDTKRAFYAVHEVGGTLLAIGEKGMVRASKDHGRSWSPVQSGFPSVFTYMRDFSIEPSEKAAFIIGQEGLVMRTTDRGLNWQIVLSNGKSS